MTATVLTIKEGMNILEQVEKELARVIDLFLSNRFQDMYLDMCGMLMTKRWWNSAKLIRVSKEAK